MENLKKLIQLGKDIIKYVSTEKEAKHLLDKLNGFQTDEEIIISSKTRYRDILNEVVYSYNNSVFDALQVNISIFPSMQMGYSGKPGNTIILMRNGHRDIARVDCETNDKAIENACRNMINLLIKMGLSNIVEEIRHDKITY